jgi:hypothetical protein
MGEVEIGRCEVCGKKNDYMIISMQVADFVRLIRRD